MQDLVWRSMVELGRMIATKEVSPVEVVRAFLERVAALDGTLKSFITVGADAALAAARGAEAELMAGGPAGPLHGVPYAPKDLYNTKGVRTTGGSKILADFVPAEDATVVSRLRAAGAIVLGKLNMHEFAYGPEGLNALGVVGVLGRIGHAVERPRRRSEERRVGKECRSRWSPYH